MLHKRCLKITRRCHKGCGTCSIPKARCSDFYFAAILTLVEAGVLRGEIRRVHRHPHVDPNWVAKAKKVAIGMGLLANKPLGGHTRGVVKVGKTLQVAPVGC